MILTMLTIGMYYLFFIIGFILLCKHPRLKLIDKNVGLLILISWFASFSFFTVFNVIIPYYSMVGWGQINWMIILSEFIGGLIGIGFISLIGYGIFKKFKKC